MKIKIFLTIVAIIIAIVSTAQTSSAQVKDSTKVINVDAIGLDILKNDFRETNALLDSVYIYLNQIKSEFEMIDWYINHPKNYDKGITDKKIYEVRAIKEKLQKIVQK